MHVHKPKPTHSLREFLSEISVVVVGILIALALEQALETWRDHRHVAEARTSIHAEIAYNLGLMQRRAAIEACVTRRLDEAAGLIDQAQAGHPATGPLYIGHPLIWFTSDGRYKSAVQAGIVSLMPPAEQARYASLYAGFDQYTADERDEQTAWSELRTLESRPATTPVSDARLRDALENARMARFLMETVVVTSLSDAKTLGVTPDHLAPFAQESVCIPLRTPRAEALKRVVEGRPGHHVYDEP
jgi:hypothetical protein